MFNHQINFQSTHGTRLSLRFHDARTLQTTDNVTSPTVDQGGIARIFQTQNAGFGCGMEAAIFAVLGADIIIIDAAVVAVVDAMLLLMIRWWRWWCLPSEKRGCGYGRRGGDTNGRQGSRR